MRVTKMTAMIVLGAALLVVVLTSIALASNGQPSPTVPSSGNTTTGAAAGIFGDVTRGQTVFNNNCAACHGTAGQPTDAFPGLDDVQNPNPAYSIDPGLYDINPALFAINIDPFIQHGSDPGGVPAPMPALGDNGTLTQGQIADAEAYVMSLSNVNWPRLSLTGTRLTGAGFVPGSSVQLYDGGSALDAALTVNSGGNLAAVTSVYAASGQISANYADLDVYGIYLNGDPTQGNLALDGTAGAGSTVAVVGVQPGLSLAMARVYWNNLADYQARTLSVDYIVTDAAGSGDALNSEIVGSANTNGVITATTLPQAIGGQCGNNNCIPSGGSSRFTLQYHLPQGVSAFKAEIYASAQSAGSSFSYPAPFAGA